jgi:hypothetical protein
VSRVRFYAVLVFLTSFSSPEILAQQTAPVDPVAVLRQASQAMGCSLINPTTTISVSGAIHLAEGATVMAVTIQSQGERSWRSELVTPKERKVTVVNNGRGQIQHADGRVRNLSENNTSHQPPMHIPCLTGLASPPGRLTASYIRTDTVGNDSLDVIELMPNFQGPKKFADRLKLTLWISRSTGYLTQLQYVNASEQDSEDTQTVEIDYSDYRIIDGLAVPFDQATKADGKPVLNLILDSVQLNTPAADFSLR